MNSPAINLTTGILPNTQIPLDAKCYFLTLASMQDLGSNNYKAFLYYEKMIITCVEDGKQYVWREKLTNEQPGILPVDYVYPNNTINNTIDYSNRAFNFFLYYPNQKTYRSNQILSGGQISWNSGLIHFIQEMTYIIQNETYTSEGGEVTHAAADNTNPRFDLIVVDANGVLSIIQGDPAVIPAQPVNDNSKYCIVSYVYIPANATTIPNATKTIVYAENEGIPTEADTTSSDNAFFEFDNQADPNNGTFAIIYKGTNPNAPERSMQFRMENAVNLSENSILEFYIKLLNAVIGNNNFISVAIHTAGGVITDRLVIQSGNYGYDENLVDQWQRITVDLNDIPNAPQQFDAITFIHTDGYHANYYMDDISLIGGMPSPNNGTDRPYWQRIEDADVHKLDSNLNNSMIEHGDKVRDKEFTLNLGGQEIRHVLPLGIYNSTYGLPSTNPDAYDVYSVII